MEDLKKMQNYIKSHVSDYCGYNHKEFLMLSLLQMQVKDKVAVNQIQSVLENWKEEELIGLEGLEIIELWTGELFLSERMILMYPGHESMWNYRKFLIEYWIMLSLICEEETRRRTFEWKEDFEIEFSDELEDKKSDNFFPSFQREMLFFQKCFFEEDAIDYATQRLLSARYILWIFKLVIFSSFIFFFFF